MQSSSELKHEKNLACVVTVIGINSSKNSKVTTNTVSVLESMPCSTLNINHALSELETKNCFT